MVHLTSPSFSCSSYLRQILAAVLLFAKDMSDLPLIQILSWVEYEIAIMLPIDRKHLKSMLPRIADWPRSTVQCNANKKFRDWLGAMTYDRLKHGIWSISSTAASTFSPLYIFCEFLRLHSPLIFVLPFDINRHCRRQYSCYVPPTLDQILGLPYYRRVIWERNKDDAFTTGQRVVAW